MRGIGSKVGSILRALGPPFNAAICKKTGGHVVTDTDAEQECAFWPIDIFVHLARLMNNE